MQCSTPVLLVNIGRTIRPMLQLAQRYGAAHLNAFVGDNGDNEMHARRKIVDTAGEGGADCYLICSSRLA